MPSESTTFSSYSRSARCHGVAATCTTEHDSASCRPRSIVTCSPGHGRRPAATRSSALTMPPSSASSAERTRRPADHRMQRRGELLPAGVGEVVQHITTGARGYHMDRRLHSGLPRTRQLQLQLQPTRCSAGRLPCEEPRADPIASSRVHIFRRWHPQLSSRRSCSWMHRSTRRCGAHHVHRGCSRRERPPR